ncbi:MAG: RNA polymerase sigma factor [Planctomycetota bacterium]|jgi:RNA polymerase sigma-70 factor (ECF subfamily)
MADEQVETQEWWATKALLDHMYRFAFKLTGNPDRADDVRQEACLRLSRLRPDPVKKKKAYLARVVRHCLYDLSRKGRKHPPQGPEVMPPIPAATLPPCDLAAQKEAAAAQKEAEAALLRLLESLPQVQQDVLRLYCLVGLPHKEIADILGRNASTIRSDLHRGIRKLARLALQHGLRFPSV